ncbi:MAG: type IV pilin protein [Syntrophobacteraceae bacterium]
MDVKKGEDGGFTLVELMIVVAIIGILASVAVPFYLRYIQKARLVSLVFPGIHMIEVNLGCYYSFQIAFPQGSTFETMTDGADTTHFSPIPSGPSTVDFVIKAPGATNSLHSLDGQTLIAHVFTRSGIIGGWALSGSLAERLDLDGEQ